MKKQTPCDFDWLSVHGPNISNPAVGYAEKEANELRKKILNSPNTEEIYNITGVKYYFSSTGDDSNDGLSPETPLKTLEKIETRTLNPGDAILLERNSIFRVKNTIEIHGEGITIGSYGVGEKPRIYASPFDFAVNEYWTPTDKANIWKVNYPYAIHCGACGMFFDHGKAIGSLWQSGVDALKKNFDFHHDIENETIYLYFDKGNPADFYKSIEITYKMHIFLFKATAGQVIIDNLCVKYTGGFPVCGGTAGGATITNCEMGYTGGLFDGVNKVRFGNAVEFYGNAVNVTVKNNWIYQIFDSAITWQGMNEDGKYENIVFSENLLEYNNADIEFFGCGQSKVENFVVENNIMRFTSMGWGTHDEEGGVRWIEGCISAWTGKLEGTCPLVFRNNIMDCPARWAVNWRSLPNHRNHVNTYNNKLYVKSSYRTTDVILRGFADETEKIDIALSANNEREAKKAFERFEKDIEIHWYNE